MPLEICYVPNCVRQTESVSFSPVDGNCLFVKRKGDLATTHILLDLSKSFKHPGQISSCAGLLTDLQSVDQIAPGVLGPVLPSRLSCLTQELFQYLRHAEQVITDADFAARRALEASTWKRTTSEG